MKHSRRGTQGGIRRGTGRQENTRKIIDFVGDYQVTGTV